MAATFKTVETAAVAIRFASRVRYAVNAQAE